MAKKATFVPYQSSGSTFTSESVCSGHPDKVCDQISDAILDEVLKQDRFGHVAVETLATEDRVVIVGEITANASVDFDAVARREIKRLGYTIPALHFSDRSTIDIHIHAQSPEINAGVAPKGAGDQGMMFGFACTETKTLMPLPIALAHALARRIDTIRETKRVPYLRPDGKTQVTIRYERQKPVAVESVVIAVPHEKTVELETVKVDVFEHIVTPVVDEFGFQVTPNQLIVNGTGIWHMSGPAVDSGLTGRKIVVDTYGGYARVGGGCFSGKDPTKVDRSGAYAARYIAKNIVAHGLAEKAEVRLAYFIGAKKPLMQEVEAFGTLKVKEAVLRDFVASILDTSVAGILEGLQLQRPIYLPTATYGHFGRPEFPWEEIVKR